MINPGENIAKCFRGYFFDSHCRQYLHTGKRLYEEFNSVTVAWLHGEQIFHELVRDIYYRNSTLLSNCVRLWVALLVTMYEKFINKWVRLFATKLIEQGLTSHQTHNRLYRGRFLQVIWPNQQCQSTEGNQLVSPLRQNTSRNKY